MLVRDQKLFEAEDCRGVYFRMRDGSKHVLCKVTGEALRMQSMQDARNGMCAADNGSSATFVLHRARIEGIAASKYADGHRGTQLIFVVRRDLATVLN